MTAKMGGIVYTVEDPVATIRLDHPERLNALDDQMLADLHDAMHAAEADRRVVGIVITGTGRAFCSGWDAAAIKDDVGEGSSYQRVERFDATPNWFSCLLDASKPVIAAVNGVAAATGVVLALMADLRLGSSQARFTSTFARRGLVAEHGIAWILPRIVGPSRALDLLFTARMVDAEEALRIGLLDRIVDGDPAQHAAEYVRGLARTSSPSSLRDTKRLVYGQLGDHDAAVRQAWNAMVASFDRPDPREGITSFIERREPRFPRLGDQ